MTGTVRSFVALELPVEAKEALAVVTRHLRQAEVKAVRTVDPGAVHLTLKFLGEVPPDQLDRITVAAEAVSRSLEPFSLELKGVGVFPNRRAPRVFWVGVGGDLDSLRDLQVGIERSMNELGFSPERRAFSPHLTVARLKGGAPAEELRRATASLDDAPLASGVSIAVDSVSLMRSILTPAGARYERLALLPLAGIGEDPCVAV